MPGSPLRLVIIEDNPSDARLVLRELQQAGFEPVVVRVETEAEFLAQLRADTDVVLCDYNLPQFDAMRALDLARARVPDVPFLIVSGSIGEDVAVEAIKRGATDYVLKDRLRRLAPAVRQALEQRHLKEAERQGREALRASEERYRALADSIPQIVWTAGADGALDYLNQRAVEYTGLALDGLTGWSWERVIHPDDLPRTLETWREVLGQGHPREFEFRIRRADGAYRWHIARQVAVRDEHGAVARWFGTCTDIHDQKAAAERLTRDALLLASVRDSVIVTDLDGVVTYWNEGATRLFGWTAAEMLGRSCADRYPEFARAEVEREIRLLAEGNVRNGEYEDYRKDGSRVWIDARVTRIADAAGRPTGIMGVSHDISDRKRSEAVLRFQHALLQSQLEASPYGVLVVGSNNRVLSYNQRFLDVWGIPAELLAAGDDAPVLALARGLTADPDGFAARVAAVYADPDVRSRDEVALADGRTLDRYSGPIRAGGELLGRVWFFRDITDRKRGEAERDRQRRELQLILDAVPALIFYKDLDHRVVRVNQELVRVVGLPRESIEGRTDAELGSPQAEQYARDEDEVVATGQAKRGIVEPITTATGVRWLQTDKLPHRDETGRIVGVLGFAVDVTERTRAEAERDEALARLRLQIERLPLAYLLSGPDFRYTRWNPAAERIFGFSQAEVLGKHPFEVIVPAAAHALVAGIFERLAAGDMDAHGACENVTGDGRTITCEWYNTPLLDAAGAFVGLLSLAQDVTSRKKLEDQFRQAQKMEAFGQLAGGVAHDFNNLLTVINGYSDLLLTTLPPSAPVRDAVSAIRDAGERAAALTAQLLAFSRKTIIEPKVFDLNAVVESISRLLRRLIGEDVRLTVTLAPTLSRVKADVGQIEQVIMNLAVNARDAMPTGGRLTVETADVVLGPDAALHHPGCAPGRYVRLTVADTGTGMTDEVRGKIFEPFFTTKGVGQGTGLGLATVYGVVTQAGGHVGVVSEVGRGTTFTVLLPVAPAAPDSTVGGVAARPGRGAETILLVEDEEAVRRLAQIVLEAQGYNVFEADCGADAIRVSDAHSGPIHLLVTDVVMPVMGGREVADAVRGRRPGLRVLYLSGYTDDAVVRYGVTDATGAFLQKPFTPDALARKVRALLDVPAEPLS